jgi:drug/metabolite transporter (DMT)-like permease
VADVPEAIFSNLGLLYLALFASALAFSLYLPVVRKIGPGKAAYSSVLVPIIAMGFSTALEGYRWTPLAAAGAVLALGGMLGALSRSRSVVPAPDAA